MHIIGILEGEERDKGIKNCIWKNNGRKFTKPKEGNRYPEQEAERVPDKMSPNALDQDIL